MPAEPLVLLRRVAVGGLLALLNLGPCGCRTPPPPAPFVPPAVTARLRYFAGTPLSGPAAALPATAFDDVCALEVSLLALEHLPDDPPPGAALASHATFLAEPAGPAPVRPLAELTAGGFLAGGTTAVPARARVDAGECGRTALLAMAQGNLGRGLTAVFETSGGAVPPNLVEVHVHRRATVPPAAPGADEIQLALVVEGPVTEIVAEGAEADADEPTATAAPVKRIRRKREFVLLDPFPAAAAGSSLLFLPSPFPGGSPHVLLVCIGTGPPRAAGARAVLEKDAALAHCIAGLEGAGAGPPAAAVPAVPAFPGLASAVEALRSPLTQRTALVLLARETGATLAEDVLLAGDYGVLGKCAGAVLKLGAPGGPPAGRPLGFVLEEAALRTTADLLSQGKLPPDLQAVLLRHAGQAGRQPESLEEILAASKSLEELRARLVEENVLALEDPSPAVRVRAYDWLEAGGRAPAGFDPLASKAERKAALEKLRAAAEAGENGKAGP